MLLSLRLPSYLNLTRCSARLRLPEHLALAESAHQNTEAESLELRWAAYKKHTIKHYIGARMVCRMSSTPYLSSIAQILKSAISNQAVRASWGMDGTLDQLGLCISSSEMKLLPHFAVLISKSAHPRVLFAQAHTAKVKRLGTGRVRAPKSKKPKHLPSMFIHGTCRIPQTSHQAAAAKGQRQRDAGC